MTEPTRLPTIAVIVPVRDGGEPFRRCLRALSSQSRPADEVIAVADGTDEDFSILESIRGSRGIRLKDRRGPAGARNAGAKRARSEILLFLDADVVAPTDLISRVAARFASIPGLCAVFGSYDDAPAASGFISRYRNLMHHFVHQTAGAEASTFWAGCGAIRRSDFLDAGGFDAERYDRPSVEDIEFGYRLRASSRRVLLDKSLQVKHLKKWTFTSMVRTDLFQRAIPWTELILDRRTLPNDLNVSRTGRASVVLAWAALGMIVLFPLGKVFGFTAILCAAGFVLLNREFYGFLAEKEGPPFMLLSVPLHLLFYLYSGLGFMWALARHAVKSVRGERPTGSPSRNSAQL